MFVQADNVEALIRTICRAAGSDEREAAMVARNLTQANLTGHDSHGVGMIPTYIPTALRGDMSIGQHASLISENGPIVVIGGNMGYGQVIGHEAMEIGRARVDEVMVPGDPERKSRAERGANGIPIDDRTWRELVETAATVGVPADEMDRLAAA